MKINFAKKQIHIRSGIISPDKWIKTGCLILAGCLVIAGCREPSRGPDTDLGEFLSRQDMVFDTLTENWHEGAFTGNGLLGVMVYMMDSSSVRFEIGRTDVTDHRPEYHLQYGQFRLPIGRFVLKPGRKGRDYGSVVEAGGRLSLYDATFTGYVETDAGKTGFRCYTHALQDVMVIEVDKDTGGYELGWQSALSVSPRYYYQNKWTGSAPAGYRPNPEPRIFIQDGMHFSYQPLLAGGGYCTAWKKLSGRKKDMYLITVGNSFPQDISIREAAHTLRLVSSLPYREFYDEHKQWWHDYYTKSFVSLPDKQFENFWWIQQYKLGSATRADAPAIDLMGPWMRRTPWAAYWFNLNVQLTYSPVYASNRLDLGRSLTTFIDNNREQLIKNVPEEYRHNSAALGRNASFDMASPIDLENPEFPDTEEYAHLPGAYIRGEARSELGNLTWLLHNYWYQCRYSMDDSLLVNGLFPLLRRSINYYLNIVQKWDDGKLHLPVTFSPEYPGGLTRDCNYDLSLFRWGLETLSSVNREFSLEDTLAPVWSYVLENLTPYPVDENGLMIGRDVPFNKSHRHYSHLLMWYPLHVMEPTSENIRLIRKSIRHWHSFDRALQGYSFTGGASMTAKMGDGNRAYDYLKTFMNDFLRPNTMYLEAGPVIETPLSALTSINEMLLQSWGDTVRVFPAVPGEWQDVAFHNLRTEGAFLVTARMDRGGMSFVRVQAEAGGRLQLKIPESTKEYLLERGETSQPLKGCFLKADMESGEEIVVCVDGLENREVRPVKKVLGDYNAFGAK